MTAVTNYEQRPDQTPWQYGLVRVGVVGDGFNDAGGQTVDVANDLTDDIGFVSFDLAPGQYYVWTGPDRRQVSFGPVPSSGGPYTLQSLANTGTPPGPLAASAEALAALVADVDALGTGPYSPSTAPVVRSTVGAPTVLSTDIIGDFAIDTTAGVIYGPLTGTPVLAAAWINGAISGAAVNYLSKAILAQVSYLPTGPSSYTTTSTSLVAIDATHVAVTFTAPASGQVWVECNALIMSSAAGSRVIFGLLNASGGAQVGPLAAWIAGAAFVRTTAKVLVTGLTAGTSYTLQGAWQTQVGTTTGTISYGSASPFNGPVNLVVTAA